VKGHRVSLLQISGWWREALVAIQDIVLPHNGEITVICGRNFLKGQGKECLQWAFNTSIRLIVHRLQCRILALHDQGDSVVLS